MKRVRSLGARIEFNELSCQRVIFLPTLYLQPGEIQDIQMMVSGEPTPSSRGKWGLVVRLNEHDLTKATCQILVRALEAADKVPGHGGVSLMREQYRDAMTRYMKLQDRLVCGLLQDPVDGEARKRMTGQDIGDFKYHLSVRDALVKKPVKDLSKRLGDSETGYNGNLHIFNYVYSHIALEPLSLNDIWAEYKKENPGPEKWTEIVNPHLIFFVDPGKMEPILSTDEEEIGGPLPIDADPYEYPCYYEDETPHGVVTCHLQILYDDKIEAIIEELKKRVDDFEKKLKKLYEELLPLLKDIVAKVGENGSIQNDYLKPFKAQLTSFEQDLTKVRDETKSNVDAIAEIKKMVEEIKAKVQGKG
ncbi:MAG: hypothetical protein HY913_04295 [Desulfomonile tiedjei]|nr:hypothetical protein [Desulfomonile tiedjei]